MFDTILFPIDRSSETAHAIALVADIATKYDSTVIVLSVLDLGPDDDVDSARQHSKALLDKATAALAQTDVPNLQSTSIEGKAAFAICDVADEREVGLIVMGCRGVGLADDAAQETSVSTRVLQLAPCPVLLVP